MAKSISAHRSNNPKDPFKAMAKTKVVKKPEKAAPLQIRLGEHGRYQIKCGLLAGEFVARAFPKPPATVRGLIAEARGETEALAIEALQSVLDTRERNRFDERRVDSLTNQAVPSTKEYAEALGQVALSAPQRATLAALSLAGTDGLTQIRMANAGGYKSQNSAKKSFLGAGRLIAAYLAAGETPSSAVSDAVGLAMLGYQAEHDNTNAAGNWILHPELREAVLNSL